jgi:Flp pilus assembly pilin Flp
MEQAQEVAKSAGLIEYGTAVAILGVVVGATTEGLGRGIKAAWKPLKQAKWVKLLLAVFLGPIWGMLALKAGWLPRTGAEEFWQVAFAAMMGFGGTFTAVLGNAGVKKFNAWRASRG